MAEFSSAVKLGDLNDFIAPSQACVLNLDGSQKPDTTAGGGTKGVVGIQRRTKPSSVGRVKLAVEDDAYPQDKQATPQRQQRAIAEQAHGATPASFPQAAQGVGQEEKAVKVSLQDCLACSGCVTSAETVLLQHQSIEELRAKLGDGSTTVIASISPQSRASLAALHGITPLQTHLRLVAFLRQLGVRHVLDTTASRHISLRETAAEFMHRYRTARGAAAAAAQESASASPPAAPLPMIASACPGWICYAEKQQGAAVLPHISTAKSPQAVMGTLVKRHLCRQLKLDPAKVYHVAIMPCFDKKLEANRPDFLLPTPADAQQHDNSAADGGHGLAGAGVPEVDSVLATVEMQQLLDEEGVQLAEVAPVSAELLLQHEGLLSGLTADGKLQGYPGGSGGYLEYVARAAAEQLLGQPLAPGPLPMKVLRNTDSQELSLPTPQPPSCSADALPPAEATRKPAGLRVARAYGFRNIQNLMRRIKRGQCEYDFIEIMACPSGCLNGGGQIKPVPGTPPRVLLEQLEQLYHHKEVETVLPQQESGVRELYMQLTGSSTAYSPAAQQLFHTAYHEREKQLASVLSNW